MALVPRALEGFVSEQLSKFVFQNSSGQNLVLQILVVEFLVVEFFLSKSCPSNFDFKFQCYLFPRNDKMFMFIPNKNDKDSSIRRAGCAAEGIYLQASPRPAVCATGSRQEQGQGQRRQGHRRPGHHPWQGQEVSRRR